MTTPTKTIKLSCECCGKAKIGEPLYLWDGEFLCAYCTAARAVESNIGVKGCGYVGQNRDEVLKELA